MKRNQFKMTRRQVLKAGLYAGAGMMLPWRVNKKAYAEALALGLSDPAVQPKFEALAPNALNPGFLFRPLRDTHPLGIGYNLTVRQTSQVTGLRRNGTGPLLTTDVWGYGDDDYVSWPGRTLSVQSGNTTTTVRWNNELPNKHLLPVDTNLHWCYSLHGPTANNVDYRQYSIKKNGVPIVTHLHGGNTDFQYDGNPEFFWTPDYEIVGPSWFKDGLNGIEKDFVYNNDVPAGNLWYHDHALGITRLNVYAGLAGFYFVRDDFDTGDGANGLPAYPYELAYAIQDRMFTKNGDLFYPAFPGDPFYEGFITEEGAELPPDLFPKGGPTALAEFFGDHMVVNGKIWPRATTGDVPGVEPRNYRMRLLNGCDSRFLVIQFVSVDEGVTDPNDSNASDPLYFWVIGSDQGLGTPAETDTLVIEPGGRYDIVVNFADLSGKRIIMKNLGGDAPFGGAYGGDLDPDEDLFPDRQTDRIMAFDVTLPINPDVPDNFNQYVAPGYGGVGPEDNVRRVALFEGKDEFGRLQPLLGVVNDDLSGTNVATAYTWFQETTEDPAYDSTEIWEIYNFTADAHPVHLHLVNFEILDREDFEYDITGEQTVLQHNGATGVSPEISNIRNFSDAGVGPEYFEAAPKDMVTALPGDPEPEEGPPTGQMVRIKAHFNKTGRYVWHCHILSHEDHEMMRVLQVVPVVPPA